MLENFQLVAIVKQGTHTRLLRIPLHQILQDELSESWHEQYDVFVNDKQKIDFDAGYAPERHEIFSLTDYSLPAWLADLNSTSIPDIETISTNDTLLGATKGLAGYACLDGREVRLFQNFVPSHVIQPGRFLFLENDTYTSSARSAMTLAGELSAVLDVSGADLLFRNFRIVNTFLPLYEYYEEASEQEIRDVLSHRRLAVDNPDGIAIGANQWYRKRFAMLKHSGVLDAFTPQEIKLRSSGYDVSISVSGDKIVFPTDKQSAKKLLQFLNEEIFRGPITDTLYETNSKRRAD